MPSHTLVVGGTGMLSDMTKALAQDGGRLSLLSRGAAAVTWPGVDPHPCDYQDGPAFAAAVEAAIARSGPIDLAVAWFHSLKLEAPRILAQRVGSPGAPGRLFQVLGSAVSDPAHPDRLTRAAAVAADLPNCRLRQVALGFRIEAGVSRWNTEAEISAGVLAAVRQDLAYSVVGVVEPWSARP